MVLNRAANKNPHKYFKLRIPEHCRRPLESEPLCSDLCKKMTDGLIRDFVF